MKKILLSIAVATLGVVAMSAQQFDLSGEFRPRFENRHGYKTLHSPTDDGANFVSQRTRLNFGYKHEKLQVYVAMQNVKNWGDVSTLATSDKNGIALHQAWAQYSLTKKVSLKMGRQEIVYDDSRIFGNVGWAQQARSHDAFLVKHQINKNNRFDVGFALNSDKEELNDVAYSGAAGYKDFQYAWYHGKFSDLGVSFLALNTGIEFDNGFDNDKEVDYMQTVGPRFTYKKDKITANAATYFQMGKIAETKVSALYYTANVGYKINDKFSAALGYEFLSGKDQNDTDADIKSFAPLFGTNHKFNGWMDYFYVGNHGGSVGLQDINATFAYKSGKFSAKLVPHLFAAGADVYTTNLITGLPEKMDATLGTEIDLNLGYKLSKEAAVNVGFSKMFATDTMENLKGGDKDANNSWAWVMFTFKPKLFSYKAPTPEVTK